VRTKWDPQLSARQITPIKISVGLSGLVAECEVLSDVIKVLFFFTLGVDLIGSELLLIFYLRVFRGVFAPAPLEVTSDNWTVRLSARISNRASRR
jgi:hypothetical protein